MRLLIDEHDIEWDEAWEITRRRSVIPITLLPEALENGLYHCSSLFSGHVEIIFEINRRFRKRFESVRRDDDRLARIFDRRNG
jgi:starch phosphorylase